MLVVPKRHLKNGLDVRIKALPTRIAKFKKNRIVGNRIDEATTLKRYIYHCIAAAAATQAKCAQYEADNANFDRPDFAKKIP